MFCETDIANEIISEVICASKTSIGGYLVHRGPEVLEHLRFRGLYQALGKENARELRLRVRIPGRAITAIPAKSARLGLRIVRAGEDRHSESPATGGAEK